MHSWMTRILLSGLAAASIAAAPVALAVASPAHHDRALARTAATSASETESSGYTESAGNPESADADGAQQAAACQKAGVTGDNVQYDDQTGSCSLDTGSNSQN